MGITKEAHNLRFFRFERLRLHGLLHWLYSTLFVTAVGDYWKPQISRNEQLHRLRRLNLATLKSSSFSLVAQLGGAGSPNKASMSRVSVQLKGALDDVDE